MEKYSHQLSNAGRFNHLIFFKNNSFISERQQIASIGNGNGKKAKDVGSKQHFYTHTRC